MRVADFRRCDHNPYRYMFSLSSSLVDVVRDPGNVHECGSGAVVPMAVGGILILTRGENRGEDCEDKGDHHVSRVNV